MKREHDNDIQSDWPTLRRYAYQRLVTAGVSQQEALRISWRFADCWREEFDNARTN